MNLKNRLFASAVTVLTTCIAVSLMVDRTSAAPATAAQTMAQDQDWCSESYNSWNKNACEVRELMLSANSGQLAIDSSLNGGISVHGWDRNEIQVLAKVQAWARETADADRLLEQVKVLTDGGITAEGPKARNREGWSVSYRVRVPHHYSLDLKAHNGGISLKDIHGDIRFEALNGGASLTRLSGDVQGHTTNGGLSVELDGDQWDGEGLDVSTTNGGVKLMIPENYSAELETGTVNGNIKVDFPITVQGEIKRKLKTTLGAGGPPIKVKTTNGGVQISH